MRIEFSVSGIRITAKSAGVSEIWFLHSKKHEKEATTTIIILAFYFIDPFPMNVPGKGSLQL